jgi:hypothetical protein
MRTDVASFTLFFAGASFTLGERRVESYPETRFSRWTQARTTASRVNYFLPFA